jgi:hypothetical protein
MLTSLQLILHYKMKRYRSEPCLCLYGLRSVSATQMRCAVCVTAVLCQSDTVPARTVLLCVFTSHSTSE